jgi:hypothetical protein
MFRECVCSLRYPAWNAHAPYCHMWHLRLYCIFPHYLINGTIFGKQLLNMKCVFWFSLQLLPETFLIQEELSEIWSKMCIDLHVKYPSFLSDFKETWIFRADFWTRIKYQILWNPFSGSRVIPCGQMDRHDEANSRFSKLCECAKSVIFLSVSSFLKRT